MGATNFIPQKKFSALERYNSAHHRAYLYKSRYPLARASGSENVDAVSECIESLWILFCRSSKLATRCRESGLVPISRLVRRIAEFGWSSLIGSHWSGAWRKCSMLSSMVTEAEPASDGHEEKRMLLAVLSHVVDNRRVVPVSLLTASSAMFTWKQYFVKEINYKDMEPIMSMSTASG